jgi:catechol 2,3-dioxygenase-like lactoylglutathione lyase family enzyme
MIANARFGHVNVIARDWRRLARFYEEVFGCVFVPPERDYSGALLEAATGLTAAALSGVHLRLPGCGENGPTLEIFTYAVGAEAPRPAPNRFGWGHIAFVVPDVAAARKEVLAAGGRTIGEVVTLETVTKARVTWCYVTDPEENILELQSWAAPTTP